MKAARAADRAGRRKKGARLGPLHGVPITIKEAFDVAGLAHHLEPSAAQGQCRRARTPRLVARLRAAGAVILGKTNVPELCADFQTDSPLFGTTKNAWDARRTAGGSTGGGAVAVAARLSPLELGSDIGGSVRNPAHYNGIFSLKPTEWRVPGRGHVPDLPGKTRTGPLHGRVRPAGALGRRSRDWRCASSPGPTATRRRPPRCRSDRRPGCKAKRPAHRRAREQSAGQGVGRHGEGRAGDRASCSPRPAPR